MQARTASPVSRAQSRLHAAVPEGFVNKIILRLLIALARLALEHDKGFASRKTYEAITRAIADGEQALEAEQ